MVLVYSLKRHDMGFGEWERKAEAVRYENLDTVSDYENLVTQENDLLEQVSEDEDDWEDVESANGVIHNQGSGVVVGWRDKRDGSVFLELVYQESR